MKHYDPYELIKFVINEDTNNDGFYTEQQTKVARIIYRGKTYEKAKEIVYGTTK